MTQVTPGWLAEAISGRSDGLGHLTVARIASGETLGKGRLSLSSAAFAPGAELDPCFTADEEDAVAPPLEWTAPPPGAQEMVLIVEDADANTGDAPGDPTCHWLVWGLPGQKGQLLEGETPPRVGKNSQRNSEWLLPAPSREDGAHRYVFQLFALDLPLTLMPGIDRASLVAAIEGHVVAAAVLVGTYKRAEPEEGWEEDDGA